MDKSGNLCRIPRSRLPKLRLANLKFFTITAARSLAIQSDQPEEPGRWLLADTENKMASVRAPQALIVLVSIDQP